MLARKRSLKFLMPIALCLMSSALIVGCDKATESTDDTEAGATNDLVTENMEAFGDPKTSPVAASILANAQGVSRLSGDALLVGRRVKELELESMVRLPPSKSGSGINPPAAVTGLYSGMRVVDGQLVQIDITFRPVTDEDLKLFSKIKSLKQLRVLAALDITDAGIEHLAALSNLEELDISYTNISDEAREKLQKALPNCKIVQTPLPE